MRLPLKLTVHRTLLWMNLPRQNRKPHGMDALGQLERGNTSVRMRMLDTLPISTERIDLRQKVWSDL